MLAALEAEPSLTVCEIGTGTGYNAALLAARLSTDNVTTIEVAPELTALTVADDGTATVTYTDLHPYRVAGDYDASLAISLRVADCTNIYCPVDAGSEQYRIAFVDLFLESWATVHYGPRRTNTRSISSGRVSS